MKVAGKAPPVEEELRTVASQGFDHIEVYLEKTHIKHIDESLQTLEESPLDPISVHIPHVTPEETRWIEKADKLASTLDAFLAIHSMYFDLTFIPELERLDLSAEYGYENVPGSSVFHLRNMILKPGHDLVLDTAHLYMAEERYLDQLELLISTYRDQLELVHLCDSTYRKDGLAFGEGSMDLERTAQLLKNGNIDRVVLEVMPEAQAAALAEFKQW